MIFSETIHLLQKKYQGNLNELTIDDVRIGLFMTALKLSDKTVGLTSTLPGIEIHHPREKRDFGPFTPNQIIGLKVIDLLESDKKNGLVDTLKVAVLNALSSTLIDNGSYKLIRETDPIDLMDWDACENVAMVGAFHSYIRKIAVKNKKLCVLEFNPDMLQGQDKQYYVPAEDYEKILPNADVIIITGLTVVNNTIDNLLKVANPKAQIMVTGPSSSFIPDVLFQHGVKIVGGVKINDPDALMNLVSQGGTGYHTFKYGCEKICLIND